MIRKLKMLGLSLVALVAMSAIGASAAQAAAGELDIGAAPATLTGQQTTALKFKMTASGLTTQCSTEKLHGTTAATSVSEATVTLETSGCTLGGTAATLDKNGCKYTLTGGVAANTAQVDYVGCATGKHYTITQGSCEITIKEQGPLSHIVFSNPTGQDVNANFTIQGIHYEGEGGCGTGVIGTHTDGDLTGEMTINAFHDNSGTEGSQVAVQTT